MSTSSSATVVLIAAIASGQGKTTVTAALARKLVKQGKRVRIFKVGPDFLDPMLLERACGTPVYALDLWMLGHAQCRHLLAQAADQADVILIEGVMGLYDGEPSSADLARAFDLPVLLVLDASAMAQTAGAIVMGMREYGPVELAGVIANRVGSERHAEMVINATRGTPVLATLSKQVRSLPERHLGLVQPDEVEAIDALLDQLAEQFKLDTAAWDNIRETSFSSLEQQGTLSFASFSPALKGKEIAIARDAAFAFLYRANLDCLRALGATVTFFSPLQDESVSTTADAIYLPGGYPELHAHVLSNAGCWRESVRAAHQEGMPIVAECGGLMSLADTLTDRSGNIWPMAGLLAGHVVMQSRLAALGMQGWATPQGQLRGHAFHYSRFETEMTPVAWTTKHPSGIQGEAIYRTANLTASYFHVYFPSSPETVSKLFLGLRTA